MSDILTVRDAAKLLGISDQMVRLHERQGRLRAVRTVGGWRLFLRGDVQRFASELAARSGR